MKILLCTLLCISALSQPCIALDYTEHLYPEEEIAQAKSMLSDDINAIIDDYNIISGQGVQAVFNRLCDYVYSAAKEILGSVLRTAVVILLIILLCTVLEPLMATCKENFPIMLFGSVEILYITISDSKAFFREGIEALERLYDFSTVLLPCLAGTSVAAGASVSAGVKYTAAALAMNLLLNVSNVVLIPLLTIYLLTMIGGTVFQQKTLTSMADFIQWCCKSALTLSVVLFTAYLNIAGLVSSSGDILASKITKTAIQTALPVVGNILSGTASSLVAGASILRNSIGVFGLLSVLGILLLPFLNLIIRYFIFYGTGKLANFLPYQRFSNLLKGLAGAYGILLGMLGTGFILIFFTLISFMQIVGG